MNAESPVQLHKAPRVPLGELLEAVDIRGGDINRDDIEGVNISKEFVPTVANLENTDISKYKHVPQFYFAANFMHVGRDITLPVALNTHDKIKFVSPAYIVFRVKDDKKLSPLYLMILFKTQSFDRRIWFNADSSVRGNLSWEDFCRIKIPLPDINLQQNFINLYKKLTYIVKDNELLIKKLEECAHAFVLECRQKYINKNIPVGDCIQTFTRKNTENLDLPFMGVNREKQIFPTSANTENIDRKKYSILQKDDFVFSGMQTGRDICIRIALSKSKNKFLVSPAYTTFKIAHGKLILPEFLFLNFKSTEMDRLGWFKSDSSVRSNLDWDRFCEIEIPLPPIDVQKAIVSLFECAEEARKIADEAKKQLDLICPAIIQKAAHQV